MGGGWGDPPRRGSWSQRWRLGDFVNRNGLQYRGGRVGVGLGLGRAWAGLGFGVGLAGRKDEGDWGEGVEG